MRDELWGGQERPDEGEHEEGEPAHCEGTHDDAQCCGSLPFLRQLEAKFLRRLLEVVGLHLLPQLLFKCELTGRCVISSNIISFARQHGTLGLVRFAGRETFEETFGGGESLIGGAGRWMTGGGDDRDGVLGFGRGVCVDDLTRVTATTL